MLQDRTLRLWNPVKGLFIKEYRGHGYEVRDVSVCNDNSKMASVGGDRQVRTAPAAGQSNNQALTSHL
jgi:mitogen-activated protein kinase organizer 1